MRILTSTITLYYQRPSKILLKKLSFLFLNQLSSSAYFLLKKDSRTSNFKKDVLPFLPTVHFVQEINNSVILFL